VDVTLLHREGEPLHTPHVALLDCQIVPLRAPRFSYWWFYWEQMAVPLALRQGKFDVYHAPAERGVPYISPCPTILTLHSATGPSYADLVQRGLLDGAVRDYLGVDYDMNHWSRYEYYWRGQVARADHLIAPSEFAREEIIKFYNVPPGQVSTVPLAVHEQFRRPRASEAEINATLARLGVCKPFLLYVGGYEPHKNVEGLLQTFARIRSARSDMSLVLVGTGAVREELLASAQHLGLEEGRHVNFLVNLTRDLTDLYDAAQLFVTLSWRETFCLPALEAMTRGVPVVASAWGATREVIGNTGRLVDPRDTAAAADAVLDLLTSVSQPEGVEQLRRRASRFDWAFTAEQTRNIYARLLAA
jgi:glycosyltransferase involved in cell wall biosynthesis